MKIEMTQTIHGSLDGLTVQALENGRQYTTPTTAIGNRMAAALIRKGVAKPAPVPGDAPLVAPAHAARATKRKAK